MTLEGQVRYVHNSYLVVSSVFLIVVIIVLLRVIGKDTNTFAYKLFFKCYLYVLIKFYLKMH